MLHPLASLDSITGVRVAANLRALRRQIEREVGRVADVILFGSRARGDAQKGSDYDIAVIITADQDQKSIDRVVTSLALPFIMAGYHFRPVVIGEEFLGDKLAHPLARNIARDGVSIR